MPTSYFKPQAPITFGTPAPKVNPAVTSGMSLSGGNVLVNGQAPSYTAPQSSNPTLAGFTPSPSANALTSALLPTSSGGIKFPAQAATSYKSAAVAPTTSQPVQSPASGLSQFIINNQPTSGGGNISMAGGNVNGYTPNPGYSINTTSPAPSSALGGNTISGLQNSHKSYADYVNALAQAQGYSPDYIAAQQGVYSAQAQGAQLGVNQAAYANQAFGSNQANNGAGLNYGSLGGSTTDYVAGTIGGEQSANAIKQSLNTQQQTQANIALTGQQLARTGNIAAAQTQLNSSPEGMAGQNAIGQYNALQQAYPGANIPEYNNALTPEQNQQVASFIVSNSPAYRSQFQQQYSTAAGGTGIYNKLDTGGLQHNADGTVSLVSDAAKALGAGQAASVQGLVDTYNKLAPAYKAANDDFSYITNFMQSAGLNQSNVPAINQVTNAVNSKILDPGAVATFKSAIASLRSNYANLLAARTGSVAGVNDEASQLIPDNLTVAQLQQVQGALNANGQNILSATQQQIQQGLSSLNGSANFSGNSQVPSGSSLYDF